MIYIQKLSEPRSLKEYRNTPGADFDGLEKTDLRKSLLCEQGYLCAYCMRKIRSARNIKIEHYVKRNSTNQLNYANLLAVCDGNKNLKDEKGKVNPKKFTCDSMKGSQALHINPQRKSDMETIYYDNQGFIHSTNDTYQNDLDEILNLNDKNGFLIQNRKEAVKVIIEKLTNLRQGQDALAVLNRIKERCENMDSNGELPEYAGIMRWYVEKQIRKHS